MIVDYHHVHYGAKGVMDWIRIYTLRYQKQDQSFGTTAFPITVVHSFATASEHT